MIPAAARPPVPRPAPGDEAAALDAILRADPVLMALLARLRALALPDWRLVSGCVWQPAWNALTGRPARHGLRDYDLAYHDASDLSWEGEDAVIARVAAATADLELPAPVETRNQARVHLWFAARFGPGRGFGPPLQGTDEGLARYLSTAHAVGVRLEADGRLDLAAPHGLGDVFAMALRPTPHGRADPTGHDAKAARALALWPEARAEWATGGPPTAAGTPLAPPAAPA